MFVGDEDRTKIANDQHIEKKNTHTHICNLCANMSRVEEKGINVSTIERKFFISYKTSQCVKETISV